MAKGTAAVARATVVAAKEMVAAGAAAVVRARRVAATGKEDTAAEERARAARGLPPSRLSKGVRRQKGVGAARGGGGGGEREGGCGGDGGVDAATQHDRAPAQVPRRQRQRAGGLQQRRVDPRGAERHWEWGLARREAVAAGGEGGSGCGGDGGVGVDTKHNRSPIEASQQQGETAGGWQQRWFEAVRMGAWATTWPGLRRRQLEAAKTRGSLRHLP